MRIRCCLSGFVLPCGCVGGVYEAYDGRITNVIDVLSPRCTPSFHAFEASHEHNWLEEPAAALVATSTPSHRNDASLSR